MTACWNGAELNVIWPVELAPAEMLITNQASSSTHSLKQKINDFSNERSSIESHSMIATQRVQPAEAFLIFTGKQEIIKPWSGNDSRLCNFSICQ